MNMGMGKEGSALEEYLEKSAISFEKMMPMSIRGALQRKLGRRAGQPVGSPKAVTAVEEMLEQQAPQFRELDSLYTYPARREVQKEMLRQSANQMGVKTPQRAHRQWIKQLQQEHPEVFKTAAAIDDYLAGDHKNGRWGKKTAEWQLTAEQLEQMQKEGFVKTAAQGSRKGAPWDHDKWQASVDKMPEWEQTQLRDPVDRTPNYEPETEAAMRKIWAKERKEGKTASVLQAILPTINESDYLAFTDTLRDPVMQAAMMKNAHSCSGALKKLMEATPSSVSKVASALPHMINPSVVQVRREEEGYVVKAASHAFWAPYEELVGRGEVIDRFGEKIALAADTEGSVTMAEGADATEQMDEGDEDEARPVTEFGVYKVQDTTGKEHIGAVIPNLIDTDGQNVPLSLFTNGSVAAVQSDIIGVCAGKGWDLPTADRPMGDGFFFALSDDGIVATIPLKLQSSTGMPGEPTDLQGETFDGRPVTVSVQPNIQTAVGTGDKLLVPAHWKWSPMGSAQSVGLVSAEEDVGKEASARRSLAAVEVRCSGPDCFSFRGPLIDKLAYDQREMVDMDGAMFLLAGLGVDQKYGIRKLGQAYAQREPVLVKVGRAIRLAKDEEKAAWEKAASRQVLGLRKYLFKEAAVIPDPTAVDVVLSLGFINPENVMSFISALPAIESAQSRMCELLIASRLGLQEIPTSALEKSIRSTEEVLEGLKILGFQGAQ